jgi:tetratricopeptide (TPR) repeat protein
MASELPKVELDFRAWLWRSLRRPGWNVILPVLLVAFAGVFAWQIFFSPSELAKGVAALKAAYRSARPVEARITAFSYAPFAVEMSRFDEHQFKRAEDALLRQTQHLNTSAALHARGQVQLARRRFDEAIQQFEAALKLEANNPQLHNDLGVAWLEKASALRAMPPASGTSLTT